MARIFLPLDPIACQARVTSSLWQKRMVITEDGCWLRNGQDRNGYTQAKVNGRLYASHRVALVAALGRDLLPGMTVGHLCHDRAFAAGTCTATETEPCHHRRCVNPEHLTEQSYRENIMAGGTPPAVNAAKTTCSRGHSLIPNDPDADLLAWTTGQGHRGCRTCALERYRARYAAIAAARTGLGLTEKEYRAQFDSSQATAEGILESLAAGVPNG
jgi:hypothetical protein